MKSILLTGTKKVVALAATLVEKSVYFTVEPLPEDIYRVSVKNDVFHLLDGEGASELEQVTVRGVLCYLDTKLDQLRPVDHPEIVISMKDESYPPEFKALKSYIDKENVVEDLIKAAEAHGQDSDPDHEVGDLQDILRTCFIVMEDKQAQEVLDEHYEKMEMYL